MKIIKKYCKYSSRAREAGWGRGRPQTRYLNVNRTRTHAKPVQCCGCPPSITTELMHTQEYLMDYWMQALLFITGVCNIFCRWTI